MARIKSNRRWLSFKFPGAIHVCLKKGLENKMKTLLYVLLENS